MKKINGFFNLETIFTDKNKFRTHNVARIFSINFQNIKLYEPGGECRNFQWTGLENEYVLTRHQIKLEK